MGAPYVASVVPLSIANVVFLCAAMLALACKTYARSTPIDPATRAESVAVADARAPIIEPSRQHAFVWSNDVAHGLGPDLNGWIHNLQKGLNSQDKRERLSVENSPIKHIIRNWRPSDGPLNWSTLRAALDAAGIDITARRDFGVELILNNTELDPNLSLHESLTQPLNCVSTMKLTADVFELLGAGDGVGAIFVNGLETRHVALLAREHGKNKIYDLSFRKVENGRIVSLIQGPEDYDRILREKRPVPPEIEQWKPSPF